MSRQPTFGTTKSGQPVHAKSRDHLADVLKFSPRAIRQAVGEVTGFNAKFAVIITSGVGTMACAYLFGLIALASLPVILVEAGAVPSAWVPSFLQKPGLILIVSWIAQTFLQLVLLSVIMVGQRVQSAASDARSEKAFTDTETIMDRLDVSTKGGLSDVLEAIHHLGAQPGTAFGGAGSGASVPERPTPPQG
jgi:hypothetical protein